MPFSLDGAPHPTDKVIQEQKLIDTVIYTCTVGRASKQRWSQQFIIIF